ncbi:MAG: O-antigen ligase family protein [Pseudomonadales bacterium]
MSRLTGFIGDRIEVNSVLIVLCFVAVLILASQSAASYPSYFLALSMLLSVRAWNDVFRVGVFWLIATLLGYLALSSLWSSPFVWRDVFSTFARALLVWSFVVAFAECQQRGQLRQWLARALAVVGVLATVAAIVNFLITQPADGRLNGLGQLHTQVIAALVYGVVLIFALEIVASDRSRAWRSIAVIGVLVIAVAVMLSDSRNAWVSVTCGVAVFALAHQVQDRQRFVAAVATTLVCLAVVLLLLGSNESTRELVLPRGDSFRLAIWSSVTERVLAHGAVFGLGINSPDETIVDDMTFLHPHSMYLSALYQGGLVALIGLLALIGWVLAILLGNYHERDAKLALGILGIALPAYLLDGHELIDKVGSTWFLFWVPVAISVGLRWRQPRMDL